LGVPACESVAQLLADHRLDAVTIATPDHLHAESALDSIAAGCHVFCEKPLATSAVEAAEVVRAAADRPVHLGVDYNRRFAFGYRTAKRLLDDGAIGPIRRCLIDVSDRTPPRHVARHPLVIFTTLLTHHFDLLRFYGGEIRSIRAVAGHQPIGPLLGDVSLSFEFKSGATGTIEARYRDDLTRTVERLELEASSGIVLVEDITGPVTCTGRDGRSQFFSPDDAETFDDSLIAHLHAFIACVARGDPPPVTGHDGLVGLQLAEAAVESIHSGHSIEVQP
jgi:myo-inositol 2-dehydrogenase/D-chiro-inositol 1-dehydrogenase